MEWPTFASVLQHVASLTLNSDQNETPVNNQTPREPSQIHKNVKDITGYWRSRYPIGVHQHKSGTVQIFIKLNNKSFKRFVEKTDGMGLFPCVLRITFVFWLQKSSELASGEQCYLSASKLVETLTKSHNKVRFKPS